MVIPVNWACNALPANHRTDMQRLGILDAANQWFNALMFLPGIPGQALLPILSERMAVKDTARSSRVMISLL